MGGELDMEGEQEMEGYNSVDSSVTHESDCECVSSDVAPREVESPKFTANDEAITTIISNAAGSLGFELKPEQHASILGFVKGQDVFVSLPTGYGKSLCYILLPIVFDRLRNVNKQSIALVVSPLIALMEDQIANILPMGISVTRISDQGIGNPAINVL